MAKFNREQYMAKLKDPRWQRKRLEVLQRDDFICQKCFDTESTLHVHHLYYTGFKDPWAYPLDALTTLCEHCHQDETDLTKEAKHKAKDALFRAGLLASDVKTVCAALEDGELGYPPEVFATFMRDFLTLAPFRKDVYDLYFAHLKATDNYLRGE